jgi:accessory gene regulator protein AgrB
MEPTERSKEKLTVNPYQKENIMKNQKVSAVVVTIVLLIALMILSKHPFDIGILFGGAYLLRWQAGGIVFQNRFRKLAAILALWGMGVIFYSYVCPAWVLYPFLLLVNITIFFFAPATNTMTVEEALWREEKNKRIGKNGSRYDREMENTMKRLEESLETRRQKKNRAVFITGILSLFTIVMRELPVSTLLFIALLAEMVSILSAIWESLQQDWEP